ncbi:MAG: histidine kinase [Gemmatimonadaceae bacterium]|nr:histidine kinase [Gemmatimonadaceae bacterium]
MSMRPEVSRPLALHSVSALVASDPLAAEEALDRIGDLFRYSLVQSELHVVRLEDEWRFVQDYLAIEQMRLGSRLTVELSLERAAAECDVPSFVLQPLVENAIRHGIGPRTAGGTVRVTAIRDNGRVRLEVSDDGQGARPERVDASEGTGLRTLRQRLGLDDAFRGAVDVETAPDRGFRVRVTLDARPRAVRTE